jgi:hypothetical protein
MTNGEKVAVEMLRAGKMPIEIAVHLGIKAEDVNQLLEKAFAAEDAYRSAQLGITEEMVQAGADTLQGDGWCVDLTAEPPGRERDEAALDVARCVLEAALGIGRKQ